MTVTLPPELERLVEDKLRSGEYRSAEDVLNAALQLLKQRDDDRRVVEGVSAGAPLPGDDRFDTRLEMLLQEAQDSGEPTEMTSQDWQDIRREGLSRIQSRKPS